MMKIAKISAPKAWFAELDRWRLERHLSRSAAIRVAVLRQIRARKPSAPIATEANLDPWLDFIRQSLDGQAEISAREMLARIGVEPVNRVHEMRVSRCLRALGFERYQSRINGLRVWRYRKSA